MATTAQTADLLSQWAQLERSGIDAARSMDILHDAAPKELAAQLDKVRRSMRSRISPPMAWQRAGLIDPWQAELLAANWKSGRVESGLANLAQEMTQRAFREKKLRSRLAFPLLILAAFGFLSGLPRLVGGSIGFITLVLMTLGPPTLVVLGMRSAGKVLRNSRDHPLARWLLRIPMLGDLMRLRARAEFLNVLSQSYRAGLPVFDGCRLAASSVRPRCLAVPYENVADELESGQTLTQSLREAIEDPHAIGLMHSAEAAGRLDETLGRLADQYAEQATEKADTLATWVPRILYILIAVAMAWQIIGSYVGRLAGLAELT